MTTETEKNIGLGGVNIQPGRLRALRPDKVKELMVSIAEQDGQLTHPIAVRPRKSGGYWLVAGLHRFEAVKKLKHKTIRANVFVGLTDNQAELMQIDENLVRADLTPAERAIHLNRRKELYEEEHPETKQGGAPAKRGGKGGKDRTMRSLPKKKSFIDDTAEKTSKHRATIARDTKRGKQGAHVLPDIVGTCLDKPNEIDALLKLPANVQAALIKAAKAGNKVKATTRAKQFKREQRERELGAKQIALPTKKYGVIVTDDAWDFEVWSRETGMDRHAANHYTVESVRTGKRGVRPEIPDPIAVALHEKTKDRFECAAEDCVLAMWTTVPFQTIATDLMRLRGFHYRSQTMWHKIRPGKGRGTGYWFINEHEVLLLGTRGDIPAPAPGKQWPSVIEAPVGKHSEKPEIFLQMLEEYFPNLPKIEFNRRGPPRPGWGAWGNEAESEAAE